ncbi:hypothetical protein UFOVP784_118 [uncultured Caudovirales phage]|uniref:Virion structural protein n=1 Tax=uncultured Caudovirales phage TaxID=2100421 RepID=A0A6J5P059_9CAUD|nr:hypothetical protein UFOVP436_118 [uncultured Caudovirales phage]CAB4162791.1 hypothetical protein UFOVP784_118 [uncultured Caudovirales phage]
MAIVDPQPIKRDFKSLNNKSNLYDVSAISKIRAEKGLPDPFSNMSFAGTDISATMVIPNIDRVTGTVGSMDVLELAEVQTISYSIHRENAPVRTIGHVNPRGFVKGGRTIAGSLIFTVFNEYAFYRIKEYRQIMAETGLFFAPLADMLPPFDIVLTFFNEYGLGGKMKIYGVTIVDEGQTMSVDDLITEQTYTFMARGIQPLLSMDYDPMLLGSEESAVYKDRQNNYYGEDKMVQYTTFIDRIRKPQ